MNLTGIIFAIAFFAMLILALSRSPIYGLYTYIVVFYADPPSRWWASSLPDLRWSLVAAAVTVLAIFIHSSRSKTELLPPWLSQTPTKLLIAFVLWFWLGSLWALDWDRHLQAAILVSKFLVVFFMIYSLCTSTEKIISVLLVHTICCMYLGYLGYTSSGAGRLDGVGGAGIDDSNTLGMQLATGVVTTASIFLYLKGWKKYICVVAMAFSMNALVMTGSRGAFLGLLAGGLAMFALRPSRYRRIFLIYSAIAMLLFGAVASQQFWDRMNTVRAVTSDNPDELDVSARSRIVLMHAQLQMAANYPFGTGNRGSDVLSSQYLDPMYLTQSGGRSSHNAILTVLVEQGLPGLLIMSLLFVWGVRQVIRLRRHNLDDEDSTRAKICLSAVGGSLTVIFVSGIFADFSKAEVQTWMIALLACLAALDKLPHSSIEKPQSSSLKRASSRPEHLT